ncbi:hypothetical protein KFJ24_06780 [Marinobacter sediminum]|uniref:hypothetical protein n=1 Tax=Marinobacter sediminum TaxID=256323 RepID=UPI00202E893A|nr:hypothetical protein [Marinobacter sediminum]MCM0612181.1 hypothetical protein [Marinobacter sediminum]
MLPKPSAEQISRALFETDPTNTCCKENDCFDEYDKVAEVVAQRLEEGKSLKQALRAEISEWFFDGDQFDANKLEPTLQQLGEEEQ